MTKIPKTFFFMQDSDLRLIFLIVMNNEVIECRKKN